MCHTIGSCRRGRGGFPYIAQDYVNSNIACCKSCPCPSSNYEKTKRIRKRESCCGHTEYSGSCKFKDFKNTIKFKAIDPYLRHLCHEDRDLAASLAPSLIALSKSRGSLLGSGFFSVSLGLDSCDAGAVPVGCTGTGPELSFTGLLCRQDFHHLRTLGLICA
jgi:hypothetical protein